MKAAARFLIIITVLIASVGCTKKAFDPTAFSLAQNGVYTSSSVSFYVGTEESFEISLPVEGTALSASGSEGLTVEYTDNLLTLYAGEPGSYTLECGFSAKGSIETVKEQLLDEIGKYLHD